MGILTKSNFLTFLDSPLHLWASTHNKISSLPLSDFTKFIMKQGQEAEKFARQILTDKFIFDEDLLVHFSWQPSFEDGLFFARSDYMTEDVNTGEISLYEIKSSTKIKKENLYDAAFQWLVAKKTTKVDHMYLMYLNPDYVYEYSYDTKQLFIIEEVTAQCIEMENEIGQLREKALKIVNQDSPIDIESCYTPHKCPYPDVCHPNLPSHSIYELTNISRKKINYLKSINVATLNDIPEDFELSAIQQKQIEAIKNQKPVVDIQAVKDSLSSLTYPLYFLDYETCNTALPLYTGYHPQQQMVFQYSLHTLTENGHMSHSEFLCEVKSDPSIKLLESLKNEIGDTGSVIVWNKTFEQSRNSEMAKIHPEYENFLLSINKRVYDLAEVFKKGMYVDQNFEGRWTIKKVLPTLVPELSYSDLEISKGDQAMVAWWEMVNAGQSINEESKSKTVSALKKYCELDTLAMVEIWRKLNSIL